MKKQRISMCLIVLLCVCWTASSASANTVSPFTFRADMPDNSQYANDYDPRPAHGDMWGNGMCGPTSAKNSMVWLAGLQKFGSERLKKKKVGNQWVDMSHQDIIEELAKKMVPGWDWDNDVYPWTADPEFVTGKKDFAKARGVKLDIKWIKKDSLNLNWGKETLGEPTLAWIMKEIDDDEDVEIAKPGHWVTVSGYMAEKFNDENDNGWWDQGEEFWDENHLELPIGREGVYDYFLSINDPGDHYNGNLWELAETIDGKLHVGYLGHIDFAVSESPVPEPVTMLGVFLGVFCLGGYVRGRRSA